VRAALDLARFLDRRPAGHRIEGQRCARCKAVQFPARTVCRICRERSLEPCPLSGRGTVYSHAERGRAVVQLEEGLLVAAQLTGVDPEDVVIGLPVEMVAGGFAPRGTYGDPLPRYRFRPILPRLPASALSR
jgi:uncharacterized OB-fold protein